MIDWDRISELQAEIGEEDFADVLEMFFGEVEEALSGLSGAKGSDLAGGLHFLKGAALNIGMAEVSGLCRAAELALKGDPGTAIDLAAIGTALDTSKKELLGMVG